MSSPGRPSPALLHADEEQLDRAALVLGDGSAFVVIVCPTELRNAALGRLRGRVRGFALPDPVEVGTPEEMLDALTEQTQRRDRVLSLTLGRDVAGALEALNWHREKTLKGAPVVLWVDDVEGLRNLREVAPDAYSFRATMVMVRGDGGPLPVATGEEPEDVARARRRLKRARMPLERAAVAQDLAEDLRVLGRFKEAEALARGALLVLPLATSDDERKVKSMLCETLAAVELTKGASAQALYWSRRALAESEPMSFALGVERRALILALWPGPFDAYDRSALEGSLSLVENYGLAPEVRARALVPAVRVAAIGGDIRRARALLGEHRALGREHGIAAANRFLGHGAIEEAVGRFVDAERCYREAAIAAAGGAILAPMASPSLVNCALATGELSVARRIMEDGAGCAEVFYSLVVLFAQFELALVGGDVQLGVERLRRLVREASFLSLDVRLFEACSGFVRMGVEAGDAGRLLDADLVALRADVDVAQDLLLSIVGPDGPPWYPIQLLDLRARLLSLTSDTLPQALDLGRRALDLARSTYPDLIPEAGRSLADNLLRASLPDDALALIAEIEPEATSRGFLKELARLRAARVLALVQRGDPPASIEPAITALREALASTDSPRITAETLRDLARRLPPTATTPDPLALAEEAHGLFVAMPMPAEEARCLEIMGDVLLARGRASEAKSRYSTARARLERYGLGLRLPLLKRKLDAIA